MSQNKYWSSIFIVHEKEIKISKASRVSKHLTREAEVIWFIPMNRRSLTPLPLPTPRIYKKC
ncbi:MAG: hypothetical protein ACTSU4_15445 [Promethearchaeota archaeon]